MLALIRDDRLRWLSGPDGETGAVVPFATIGLSLAYRSTKGVSPMPASTPPTGADLPDSDASLRHTPSPNPPGNVATDTTPPAEGAGISASDWGDPGTSDVLKGTANAGGPDGDHPHLFHLSEATANTIDGGGLRGAHDVNWPMLKGQNGAAYIARLEPGRFASRSGTLPPGR